MTLPEPIQTNRQGWPWQGTPPVHPADVAYPRFTLVTPTYNQADYIEETIRSVLLQGYPNLEYIVMDGGSTDDTRRILQHYDSHITYWVSEPDNGQAHAINKGFNRSTGEIMGWLNSDDVLEPGALKAVAETFMQKSHVNVVTGFRRLMDADSQFIRNWFIWSPQPYWLQRGCVIAQETTFWRRLVWQAIGGIDESYQFAMDYEYWQRMLQAGYRFHMIHQYLGRFREHEAGKSSAWMDIRARDLARIYQHYGIAQDEEEADAQLRARLGANMRQKHRMLKEFGSKSWSESAWAYRIFSDMLRVPVLSSVLVRTHKVYNRLRGRYVYENLQQAPQEN